MKKFVLLYIGSVEPTQEVMDGWTKWFGVLGNRVVDSGNPFGAGKEITKSGSKDLSQDAQAISGYTIINAESIEEVEKLAEQCPIVTSIRAYEALPM
ncbi:MAG: hypothetical protein ACREHC_08065 [Candidatus Levyibacteriota bacterium]